MKNKENILKLIIIGILFLILLVILILIITKSNKLKNDKPENLNDKISCTKELSKDEFYMYYSIAKIDISNNLAKSRQNMFGFKFNDKDNYEAFKANEEFENTTYDDENLTLTYSVDDAIDLTTDQEGNKIEIEYKTILEELETDGYICNLK